MVHCWRAGPGCARPFAPPAFVGCISGLGRSERRGRRQALSVWTRLTIWHAGLTRTIAIPSSTRPTSAGPVMMRTPSESGSYRRTSEARPSRRARSRALGESPAHCHRAAQRQDSASQQSPSVDRSWRQDRSEAQDLGCALALRCWKVGCRPNDMQISCRPLSPRSNKLTLPLLGRWEPRAF